MVPSAAASLQPAGREPIHAIGDLCQIGADLAIWDRNPYDVATDPIKDMRCLMTLYKGRVVFDRMASGR